MNDTFVYQYDDFGNESGIHAGDANAVGIGTAVIAGFSRKTDVLAFRDETQDAFSRADLQNAATVADHGLHHDVDIVIHTSAGMAVGTIVLKGLGTVGHKLNSINALVAHGFHLEFI